VWRSHQAWFCQILSGVFAGLLFSSFQGLTLLGTRLLNWLLKWFEIGVLKTQSEFHNSNRRGCKLQQPGQLAVWTMLQRRGMNMEVDGSSGSWASHMWRNILLTTDSYLAECFLLYQFCLRPHFCCSSSNAGGNTWYTCNVTLEPHKLFLFFCLIAVDQIYPGSPGFCFFLSNN
jgi:hypothetical protein